MDNYLESLRKWKQSAEREITWREGQIKWHQDQIAWAEHQLKQAKRGLKKAKVTLDNARQHSEKINTWIAGWEGELSND